MATSYRIKIKLQNKSFTVGPDIPTGMGATVIPADRGPMAPVKLNKGETERIKMLFGANRYEVLEAIAYNNRYPIWISAPHSGGSFAALLLTDNGLKPCPISFSGDPNTIDFTNLWLQFKAGISDGVTGAYGLTFDGSLLPGKKAHYVPRAALIIDDEPYDTTLEWDGAITGYKVSVVGKKGETIGNGTAVIAADSIVIDYAFEAGHIPPKGSSVAFRFTTDTSQLNFNVYALIGLRFPCDDFLAAAVYKSEIEGNLILDLQYKKKGVYYQQSGYPIEMSLNKGTVNGSGLLIYAPELLEDDDFIFVQPNANVPMDWDVWTGGNDDLVDFKGGFRGAKCNGQLLVEGWEQFKEFKKFPANIYFDTTADPLIPAEFSALRAEIPYRQFLYPEAIAAKAKDIKGPPMVQNRGIFPFIGSAYIRNSYEPTGNLLSTLMGEVASRYADSRVFSFGGRAVAWGDENQVGGQLNQGRIVEFLHDFKEDEMQQLDKYRRNPIVLNELFGPMVASRRTSDTSETDYSYSDYSMIIDYCIERIVNEVLPYQLIKFNDDNHRAVVRAKAELILKPLSQAPNNVIRDFSIKCDSENNNDDVLTRQEFVLTVAIKVTPKSEFIVFNFINSAQGGSVEEDVK
jgi:hypothetical protein